MTFFTSGLDMELIGVICVVLIALALTFVAWER